jgi:hypothetical protein
MARSSTIRVEERQFLDPRWRLSNLYTITDKAGRAVPFRPNTAQLRFLDEVHSLNLILKARQLGFTTLCCLIHLDACLFSPHTRAGVIAHRLDDAKVIFRDKVRFPYDRLDEGLRAAVPAVQDSATSSPSATTPRCGSRPPCARGRSSFCTCPSSARSARSTPTRPGRS